MAREHLDTSFANGRIQRNDHIETSTALSAQELDERLTPIVFENTHHLLVCFNPSVEIQPRVMQFAPSDEDNSPHFVRMPDSVVGGDGGSECDRDDNGPGNVEMFDERFEITPLVLQRIAKFRRTGEGVAAPVIGQAPVVF